MSGFMVSGVGLGYRLAAQSVFAVSGEGGGDEEIKISVLKVKCSEDAIEVEAEVESMPQSVTGVQMSIKLGAADFGLHLPATPIAPGQKSFTIKWSGVHATNALKTMEEGGQAVLVFKNVKGGTVGQKGVSIPLAGRCLTTEERWNGMLSDLWQVVGIPLSPEAEDGIHQGRAGGGIGWSRFWFTSSEKLEEVLSLFRGKYHDMGIKVVIDVKNKPEAWSASVYVGLKEGQKHPDIKINTFVYDQNGKVVSSEETHEVIVDVVK